MDKAARKTKTDPFSRGHGCAESHRVDASLKKMREAPEVLSWRALMGAFRTVYAFLEKGLASEDCSMTRFQILLILYFDGPQTQAEIGRLLLLTRGNMSMFFKRLVADGLIAPVVADKRKRPPFTLTRKGVRLFEELFPVHIMRIRKRMKALDRNMLRQLQEISSEGGSGF